MIEKETKDLANEWSKDTKKSVIEHLKESFGDILGAAPGTFEYMKPK